MRLLLTALFFLIFLIVQGQKKQLLYNVDDLPQTLLSNPGAAINFGGHIGIPFFSQFSFSAGSSGVSVHDIFEDSGEDINSRVDKAIKRLTRYDYFTAQQQLEIFSIGWRLNKDHYLSAGIYQEVDFFAYFPKDPATLVNEGNYSYINVPFDFSDVSFTGEALMVYHLGLNKKIDRQLTVGGRVKLYSGIFNVESIDNTGMFITRRTPDGPNYYRHYVENLNVRVNTAGYSSISGQSETVQDGAGEILKRSFFGGNVGAGIDIGATYVISDEFVATGSVQDIGFVLQHQDVENYLYYGSYQTDGIEPLFPEVESNGQTLRYWDIFEDEVDANLIDETLHERYVTWRPFKINTSIEYGFGQTFAPCDYRTPVNRRHTDKLGFQFFGIYRPRGMKYALSTYYDKKFSEKWRMKFAYTLDDFSYTNIGLLVSHQMKFFNVYLAADNLLGYFNLAKTRSVSLQFGMQVILNRK